MSHKPTKQDLKQDLMMAEHTIQELRAALLPFAESPTANENRMCHNDLVPADQCCRCAPRRQAWRLLNKTE